MDRVLDLLKKTVPIICLGVATYLGETGKDGGLVKDLWNAAKTASPFAAMFAVLAWLAERRERREAQRQCNERTIDFIKSTNASTGIFERVLKRIHDGAGRRGRGR